MSDSSLHNVLRLLQGERFVKTDRWTSAFGHIDINMLRSKILSDEMLI